MKPSEPGWLSLVKTVEQLAGAAELSDIIDIVRTTARDISGADGICFVLKDGERCHYVDENAIAPLWKGKRFPLSTCVSGWCMMHDQTAVVTDVFDDARVPVDAYSPTFVKSMVVVPVRNEVPVGAIGFYWAHKRSFEKEILGLLEALGRSASAAFAAVKARESWRESQQSLALALDAGGLGAFEVDLTDGSVKATKACADLFGINGETPLTLSALLEKIDPADRAEAGKVFGSELMPGGRSDAIYRLRRDGGLRRVELQSRLVFDPDGRPCRVSGVVRDVTERFEAKERLDALMAETLRASRLTDLGAMASALAHELNQPLAAGNNYIKAAERLMAKDPEKALDAMSKAGMQFVRTKDIIQRIRGFVGQGQASRKGENIESLLQEVLELARIAARHHGVTVHLKVETGLPMVELDRVQIEQVLFNLLRNAAEALENQPTRQVTVSAVQKGEMLEIRVHDTGPGLSPEIAENLFMPFRSTKEGGMGVGLSLCRKIVDSHGGKLWYEGSEITGEAGASFVFTLPLHLTAI
nr:ATP-binding protein [Rhizomicrobium palustre]